MGRNSTWAARGIEEWPTRRYLNIPGGQEGSERHPVDWWGPATKAHTSKGGTGADRGDGDARGGGNDLPHQRRVAPKGDTGCA